MTSPRPTPPYIFALTIVPFAAAVGYVNVPLPFWLRDRGVSLAAIGVFSGVALAPHGLKWAWVALLDVGERRRAWFVAMSLLTGALLVALGLLPQPEHHLTLLTVLATAANVTATTACAAADGLMALTTAPEHKGSAAAWRMAGNVGGTGLLGWAALECAKASSVAMAGALLGALTIASALAALAIHEPRATVQRAKSALEALGDSLWAILVDLWKTLGNLNGVTACIICAVPVGAAALTNLFSGMAQEYGAGERLVGVVTGLGGGLAGAAGSFVGGWLADRMNRRLAYAISGAVLAASAFAMMAGPMRPATFAWGVLLYNLATGIAFSTLAAFVLEMCGHGAAAATKYTVFIAIANLAGSYVTALDGWASEFRGLGARGSLLADALLTVIGILVLLLMIAITRRARPARAEAASA